MKTLKLVLKHYWFDMIYNGYKTEEYRQIKESIVSLLFHWQLSGHTRKSFTKELILNGDDFLKIYYKDFAAVEFYRGYNKSRMTMKFELTKDDISIGKCNPEWSDNAQGNWFKIKLGQKL